MNWGVGVPSQTYESGRTCKECGKKLSIYNKSVYCYNHDNEDFWDEYVELKDEWRYRGQYQRDLTDVPVPPVLEGEKACQYARRVMLEHKKLPLTAVMRAAGFSLRDATNGIGRAKRWFAVRSAKLQKTGGYGDGYELVWYNKSTPTKEPT